MKLFGFDIRREQRSIENPQVSLGSMEAWREVFKSWEGISKAGANITIDTALEVPAVWAAVSFLSRTLAALPLHVYRDIAEGAERIKGGLQTLIHESPNPGWTSYGWRSYSFWQTFTGGRQGTWIERGDNIQPIALWPLEPDKIAVKRSGGVKFYEYKDEGRVKRYEAADIIDVPFALHPDQLGAYSPINRCRNAIGLAVAMEEYASKFFAGGGVPPLALQGPLPQGPAAFERAMRDISRAVKQAKESNRPFFGMPPGHELKQIGFDPEKGQMTEARRFQIEEIARAYQLPPVFLQDLTHGTFSNTEQQDLHLVKHLIAQWAQAFEQELNLKLFGQRNGKRYVKHNLDGLQRGDFKSRIEGLVRGVQGAILTPDEARALEDRPSKPNGDKLYIQGATVPLGTQPTPGEAPASGEGEAE
jgi:HK97 family phage portal protein